MFPVQFNIDHLLLTKIYFILYVDLCAFYQLEKCMLIVFIFLELFFSRSTNKEYSAPWNGWVNEWKRIWKTTHSSTCTRCRAKRKKNPLNYDHAAGIGHIDQWRREERVRERNKIIIYLKWPNTVVVCARLPRRARARDTQHQIILMVINSLLPNNTY